MMVKGFPFRLPYQITKHEVVILALAHMSRRPGYWDQRLREE
jgi:hypothetical protein